MSGRLVVAALLVALAAVSSSSARAHAGDPVGRHTIVLGRSVDGRTISAIEVGDLDSERTALVVGCIHGNECAGIPVARRLAQTAPLAETDLWILPNLNPDGAAAATRGNAHGVDLNRNFPWRWVPLGGTYFSGPRPLSEPETRIAVKVIAKIRPLVSIWFHQHLDLVDDSSGSRPLESRFARIAGMRLAPLPREPGSAVTWESHCFPHASAFVVELPGGALAARAVDRLARAVRVTAAAAPAAPRQSVCRLGG